MFETEFGNKNDAIKIFLEYFEDELNFEDFSKEKIQEILAKTEVFLREEDTLEDTTEKRAAQSVVAAERAIVNPNAPTYTKKWASFETMTPDDISKFLAKMNKKRLLVKDKYGKLPIEYALKNMHKKGAVQQNDAFNYVWFYSKQVGLTPNYIVDEESGMTLAMLVLAEEDTNDSFNFKRTFHNGYLLVPYVH